MSSTNKTTNYNLSQFIGTDVPSYLGDYNGDMSKIDKAIGDVANSQGSVEQSVVGLTAEVQGLSTQVSGVSTSVQQVQTSVAQIDTAYKQADTALSQRITANANNIQTNTTAIESANTAIGNINTAIGTTNISEIGDGTIKGAISSMNSSLNVKYNPDSDTIQILYNGIWNNWKPAGLQTHYLYNLGEFVTEMDNGVYKGTESAWNLSAFTNSESGLYIPTLGDLDQKTIITNNIIDLSNYSALVIEYTYGGTNYKKQVDISAVSSGYIEACITNFHGDITSSFGVTSSKTGFLDNVSVGDSFYTGSGNTIPSNFYIQKLYLK